MFYLLTLPFRLVFGLVFGVLGIVVAVLCLPFALLFLPFLLLRVVLKTAFALMILPFVLLVAGAGLLIAFAAVSLGLLIPLLPVAFVAFCIWAIVRASRPAII